MSVRATTSVVEVQGSGGNALRATTALAEVFGAGGGRLRATTVLAEVLGTLPSSAPPCTIPPCAVPIFPGQTIVPRTFDVKRTQVFATLLDTAFSGRESRMYQQLVPLWQFDLKYDFLRERTQNQAPYSPYNARTEFQQITQMFNWCAGQARSFYFDDPTDDSRSGQAIATGDGTTKVFTVVRTLFVAGAPSLTEAVGGVNFDQGVTVYLNGIAQSPSSFSIAGNVLTFVTAPGSGVAITMDFFFWYLCRFLDDKLEIQEFMKNLWELGRLRFRSLINTQC